jgi:hypothetical protein
MSDELTGKPYECQLCKEPMMAVSVSLDWCKHCGSVYQYHIKAFRESEMSRSRSEVRVAAKKQAKKKKWKADT